MLVFDPAFMSSSQHSAPLSFKNLNLVATPNCCASHLFVFAERKKISTRCRVPLVWHPTSTCGRQHSCSQFERNAPLPALHLKNNFPLCRKHCRDRSVHIWWLLWQPQMYCQTPDHTKFRHYSARCKAWIHSFMEYSSKNEHVWNLKSALQPLDFYLVFADIHLWPTTFALPIWRKCPPPSSPPQKKKTISHCVGSTVEIDLFTHLISCSHWTFTWCFPTSTCGRQCSRSWWWTTFSRMESLTTSKVRKTSQFFKPAKVHF